MRRLLALVSAVLGALVAVSGAAPVIAADGWSSGPGFLVLARGDGARETTLVTIDPERPAGKSDAPPAWRIEIEAPVGATVDVARPIGTEVGAAVATLEAEGADADQYAPLNGKVVVDDPSLYPELAVCGSEPVAAVWVARLTILGQRLNLPIALRPAAGGGSRLELCPAALHFEGQPVAGTLHLTSLQVLFDAVVRPPQGRGYHVWRAIVTPYATIGGGGAEANAYELRSVTAVPHVLTLAGRYDAAGKRMVVHGRLTAAGKARAGVDVEVLAEQDGAAGFAARVRTDSDGTFTIRRRISRTTSVFAEIEPTTGSCMSPSIAPAGCVLETIVPPDTASLVVVVPRVNDPKTSFRATDQAVARRIGVARRDLPDGWAYSLAALPRLDPAECRRVDESDLTVTGEARAAADSEDGTISSHVRVFATEAQARAAFGREARTTSIRCLSQKLASEDFVVEGIQVLQLAALPVEYRVFRVSFTQASRRVTFVDFAFLRSGRSVVQLTFGASGISLERELLSKIADRLQSNAT